MQAFVFVIPVMREDVLVNLLLRDEEESENPTVSQTRA